MLEFEQLKKDIAALPEADQQLVSEFVAMLKNRHGMTKTARIRSLNLENEPFVGMWKDRPEMQDSTAWIKQVRREHWG